MNKLLVGMDIYFGKGVDLEEIADAIAACTPIDRRAIVREGADDFIDVVRFGKWAWLYDIPEEPDYPLKASVELNERTDFLPIIRALQRRLGVNIMVPDEDSPVPSDMLVYRVDGRVETYDMP